MPSPISPIDEPSYSDSLSFDPEAFLNGSASKPRTPVRPKIDVEPDTRVDYREETDYSARDFVDNTDTNEVPGQQTSTSQYTEELSSNSREKSVKRQSAVSKFISLVLDSRTVRFIGLVMVITGIYTLIVSISFFAHIGSDQSAVLCGDLDPEMINNTGGPIGAWLSNTLINDWLGLGAFLLIIWFVLTGLSLMKFYKADFWGLTMRCLLSAVALSIVCGFITCEMASPFYWGGRHGHLLNEKLLILTGFWGALGVSLIMAGMVIFLYLTQLRKAYIAVSGHVSDFVTKYNSRRDERRRQKEESRARQEEERRKTSEAAMEAESLRRTVTPETRTAPTNAPKAEPMSESKKGEVEFRMVTDRINSDEDLDSTEDEKVEDFSEPASELRNTREIDEDTTIFNNPMPQVKNEESPEKDEIENEEESEVDEETTEIKVEDEEVEPSLFNLPTTDLFKENVEATPAPLFSSSEPTPKTVDQVLSQPKFDPRAELSGYRFPSIDLLRPAEENGPSVDNEEMEENMNRIKNTLNNYGIPIRRIEATVGPTVTLYEIIPAEGVRIARIKHLEDDIALSLSALGIRIIAPIPGKGTIGIEVPNRDPQTVSMRSVIESPVYQNSTMDLPMAMGCTISNEVFMADLCKMPHLLVAGATGMGKSVGLNTIIASLLYKKHPAELKFVLIDPKMVEFSLYSKLERHYLAKLPDEEDAIITDPSKVIATLNSLCIEMDNRYALLKNASMRNIKEYNDRFINHHLNPEKGHRFLPYIVVIVDEFADLIMTAGKEVETPIARIAQKARAVGIHMILATQRPSANVITGIIKANFPGRIAFRVFQMVDSRTILDRPGANQLIGRGDMLFSNNGKLERVQCAFIDTPEVSAICEAIDAQVGYDHAYDLPEYVPDTDGGNGLASVGDRDPLFEECARLVVTTDTASTSSLQRRYSIGYNRAGKIMDQMEAAGIVGPSQGGKPRQVLIDPVMLERILENK